MSLGSATPIAHINLALLGSPVSAPGRYPQSANASALSGGSLSINPALTIDTGHHTPNFDGVPTRFNVTYKHPSPQISLSASFEAADAMLAAASYRQQSLSHFYPPGKSPQAQSPQAKKTFPSVGNTSEGVSSSLSKQSSPVSPHHSPLSSQHSSLIANQSPDLTESKSQASSSAHLVLEQQESERRQRDQKVLKSIASRLYGRHRHLERAFAKRDILKQGDLSPGHIRDGFAEAGIGLSDFEFDVLVRCQPHTATSLALEPARVNHQYISRWLRAAEKARDDTAQLRASDGAVSSSRQNTQFLTRMSPVHVSPSDPSCSDLQNPQYVAKQFSSVDYASSPPRAIPSHLNESAVAALTAASMEALSKRVRSGATWKVFRDLDTDGSGEIELSELRTGLQRIGFVMDDQSFDALARHLDSNGDGRIQYEEFVQKMNPKEYLVSEVELMSRSQRHASLPAHLRESRLAGNEVGDASASSPLTFGGVRSSQNGSNRNSSVGFAAALRDNALESGVDIPAHEAVSAQQQHYAAFRLSSHGVTNSMTSPSPCVTHSAQHANQGLGSFLHFQSPEQQPRVVRSPAIYGAHHHANSVHARAALQDSIESSESISGEISGQYVQRRGQGLGQAGRQVSAIAHRHTMHSNTRTRVQTPTRSEAGRAIAPRSSLKSMRESHLHASEHGSPARILSPAMECGTRSRGPATPTSSAASANAAVFSPGGSIRATYARSSAPATPRSTRGEMAQAVNDSSSALSSRLSQVESQLQRAFIPSTAAEVLSAQRARRELCLPDYMHTRITAAPALTE